LPSPIRPCCPIPILRHASRFLPEQPTGRHGLSQVPAAHRRTFLVDGDPKPGIDLVKQHLKIYRLADAANPPKLNFVNISGKPFSMDAPADYRFWELLSKALMPIPKRSTSPRATSTPRVADSLKALDLKRPIREAGIDRSDMLV
jgi:hypothetical protein